MKKDLILVFTSPDRPGIVEELTSVVIEHGGNWEESRLARLCGDFAGIARVKVAEQESDALTEKLESLSSNGLHVHVKQGVEQRADPESKRAQLECSGADSEGIVNTITAFLSEREINVEELATSVEPAPTTGTPVFKMSCRLGIPVATSRETLASELHELTTELAVDLSLDGKPL